MPRSPDKRPPTDDTVNDEYKPADKEAPTPATDSSAVIGAVVASNGAANGSENVSRGTARRSNENEVADTFVKVKKPRHKAVQAVADAVKSAVGIGSSEPKKATRKLSPQEIAVKRERSLEAVALIDKRRMKAVERYGDKARVFLRPLVRAALREKGLKSADKELVERIVEAMCNEENTHYAGFMIDELNQVDVRELPLDKLLSYTFGSNLINAEDWIVQQWINHPTMFDALVVGGAMATTALDMLSPESEIGAAIIAEIERQTVKEAVAEAQSESVTPDNN
jgi:hypothetical protein